MRTLRVPRRRKPTLNEAFAQVLRLRRIELGLTQSDLEHDDRYDRSYISKLELAKREVGLVAFVHIAHKLQMEPWELMKRVEEAVDKR